MKGTILCLSTLLFSSCPKTQKTAQERVVEVDEEVSLELQTASQFLARYLVENTLYSERYDGLYMHSYESVQGPVTLYYKPAGTEVVDTASQHVLFATDKEYFQDIFIFAPSYPSWNYIDIDADGTLDYIVDITGRHFSYDSFSPQAQEQYSTVFELSLSEIIERLQEREQL
jgi:hypothetical protein